MKQREVIYAERMQVLNGENMRGVIMKMLTILWRALWTCPLATSSLRKSGISRN